MTYRTNSRRRAGARLLARLRWGALPAPSIGAALERGFLFFW